MAPRANSPAVDCVLGATAVREAGSRFGMMRSTLLSQVKKARSGTNVSRGRPQRLSLDEAKAIVESVYEFTELGYTLDTS